ncbi:caspase family protein [Streptomyces rhizosphaericus]|uniref:Caspase family protein n=1 Tax=Streptomyces rhizosphaericus TaxID=114699 RepID=A0A6G4A9J0_9ACTN|nr:caspase family protein [Streptomyces rhizosphaericus]NEW69890.1 caspase family protein [Streptomyces rhizosphaericus]
MAEFVIHLDEAADQARTHAMVIGVGKYPHLAGGETPVADPDGMRQLSSPPISARAFATWLLAEYNDPRKPLGSLSLLLSEETPTPFVNPRTGTAHRVEVANIDTILDAVTEWRDRGHSHVDNRLIFYFCGHGVAQGNTMALLAADIFEDTHNPLNGALDFTGLMNGLKRCKADQQVFFIDACRANSDVLIEESGTDFAGRVPFGAGRRPPDLPRRLHIPYYATLAGDRSHARPGQVSLFTEALLKSLRGAGSDDPEGDWRVNTSHLLEAIDHFMQQPKFAGAIAGVQVPVVGELPIFVLHQLSQPPVVPVYVGCAGAEENSVTEFICRQAGVERLRRTADDSDIGNRESEWSIELAFGDYEFEAKVSAQDVRTKSITVRPVFRRVRLVKP